MDDPEDRGSNDVAPSEGTSAPYINEDVALATVAQAESTRSYLLAQTLESTKTVPVVSAKLPLEGEQTGEVVGSFTYRGITYAVEPGGESVAIVAADHAKLPSDFLEAQTIVLPSVVSFDGIDSYSVSRIAEGAFSNLTVTVAEDSQDAAEEDEGIAGRNRNGSDAVDASDGSNAPDAAAAAKGAPESNGSDALAEGADRSASDGPDGAFEDVTSSDDDERDAADDGSLSDDARTDGGIGSGVPSEPSDPGADEPSSDEAPSAGITAITIPASITTIEDDAFRGFETLQYIIVSDDNPSYSMYDGCLYDKPQESLLLIPEGRLGAVRVPSTAVTIPEDVVSHCAYVTSFIVEPDSAASQLLEGSGFEYKNGSDEAVEIVSLDFADEETIASYGEIYAPSYDELIAALGGDASDGFAIANAVNDGEEDDMSSTFESASSYAADAASGGYIKIGQRDINGKPTGSGGSFDLKHASFGNWYIACYKLLWADVYWTGGGTTPPVGATVNVNVIQMYQNAGEGTLETLLGSSVNTWGASSTKRCIGIRDPETGCFVSLDAILGGKDFTLTFKMPASGCTVNSDGIDWKTTTYVPVFEDVPDGVVNRFLLNIPSGSSGYWENADTGYNTGTSSYPAVTYSIKGQSLQTPQNAVPFCSNHTFLGWYTAANGGEVAPLNTTDAGATYYAHWGVKSSNTIKIGARDAAGVPTGAGGNFDLKYASYGNWYIASSQLFWADVTWTGGGSTPAAGSYVNVDVLRLYQNAGEATVETFLNSSISWGGDATKKCIGLRSPETGCFVSTEAIQSGNRFTLTFQMPSSGCTIDASGIIWRSTSFIPVWETVTNGVINRFDLNAPDNNQTYWRNPDTGYTTGRPIWNAVVYSTKGAALQAPTKSIPERVGYVFLGWFTAASGGTVVPEITTDAGATYYAHWEEGSTASIKIGARDAAGEPTGAGGNFDLKYASYGNWYIASSQLFWADVTWTGGGSTPAAGSTVNVKVLRLYQNAGEATVETLRNSSLSWGGSATKKCIGLRDPNTGCFVSVEAVQGGNSFALTFQMPSSGCTIDASGIIWRSTSFIPVWETVTNGVINRFDLNAPDNNQTYWRNPDTGYTTGRPIWNAVVYSTKGGILETPVTAIPEREGYVFLGWYTAASGGTPAPALTTDAGATYYAHWTAAYYQLDLHSNIPNSDTLTSEIYSVSSMLYLPANKFTRIGYAIISWTTSADGSGTKYNADQSYAAPALGSTTTLYAQWTPVTYTISYDLKGGSVSVANKTTYTIETSSFSLNNPTRTGYTFAGWMGTGLSTASSSVSVAQGSHGNRAYTATWKANSYKMTFDKDTLEGAVWKSADDDPSGEYDEVVYDEPVTFPAAPVRSGWIFSSWVRIDGFDHARYGAGQTVDPGNFETDQGETAEFEAHWVRNLEITVPVGSQTVNMAVSADFTEDPATAEFDVKTGMAKIVNLSDGELKVVSIAEDASDDVALQQRRAAAADAFDARGNGGAILGANAVRFVLAPTTDGVTPDVAKKKANLALFGSCSMDDLGEGDDWVLPASSDPVNGTEASTLCILYDMAFDYSKISITDLKLNLEAEPISSLIYTVELVDQTVPSYGAGA